ncbi:MAG: Cell division protein FtsB [Chloroflexi bacterium]|nr:MAG: Cell division protein FtsB [Chloroflexota bacterium]
MPVWRSSRASDADSPSADPFDAESAFSEPSSLHDEDVQSIPIDDFPQRRRLTPLLFFFAALALVGYFVFTAMDGGVNTNTLDARITALTGEIDDLEWQAEQLEALVSFLDSDEYIERVAREDLGLVRVGEEAFAIQSPLRPGIQVLRSPWWANLLPTPDTPATTGPDALAPSAADLSAADADPDARVPNAAPDGAASVPSPPQPAQ